MLLAGNGSSSSKAAQPRQPVQAPILNSMADDVFYVKQPVSTLPCSGLSSPLSVSSHPVVHKVEGSAKNEESAKNNGGSITPVNKVEAPIMVTSRGLAAAATMSGTTCCK